MHAWTGKLLRADLTAGSVAVEEIPLTQLQDYLGGRGLAVRYLIDEIDPEVEETQKLVIARGSGVTEGPPCTLYGRHKKPADRCPDLFKLRWFLSDRAEKGGFRHDHHRGQSG